MSHYLFGASIILGVDAMLLAEQLPEWWGPVSFLVMIVAASAFFICSVLEYRRGRAAVDQAALRVKVQNGAKYTVTKRLRPGPGQRSYYWPGDNGHEVELSEKELAELH